jgi:uncharacterized protein (TIGR02302 family)
MATRPGDPRDGLGFRARVMAARLVVAFERLWAVAWPCLGVIGLFLALSLLGLWQGLPQLLHGLGLLLFAAALVAALLRLRPGLRLVSRREGLARIERDSVIRHEPLQALDDHLPAELRDPVTSRLWQAHRARLLAGLERLRLAPPRSALPRLDPWALRGALVLLLVVAMVDAGNNVGSRLMDAFRFARAAAAPPLPLAASLWVTPPAYTGRAPIGVERSDDPAVLVVPVGSAALVQLHHLPDAETAAPRLVLGKLEAPFALLGTGSAEARLELGETGLLAVQLADGAEVAAWPLDVVPDAAPTASFAGEPTATHRSVLRIGYEAEDDYGVVELALLLAPKGRDDEQERMVLVRPAAQAARIASRSYLDLTAHPLAGLPVVLRLEAVDAIEQTGRSAEIELVLPEREFRHPLARAVIEQRKTLMGTPDRQREVSRRLDALADTGSARQLGTAVELGLRIGSARLRLTPPGAEGRDGRLSVAELLWDLALYIEDGALSVAERDLRDIQEALERALLEGADDAELERLMNELQEAMQRYLDELARQALDQSQRAQAQQMQPFPIDPSQLLNRQDLQEMLDRARELMRSGARDAARQMLAELREMLENLRAMTMQQQMSPGQQALSDLQRMIQLQRQLLERSFEMQRQMRNGEMQRQGQSQQGMPQQGMPQDQMGQSAMEQDALRRALGELMRRLGEQGMEIPRALGQAELEMRGARDSLQEQAPGDAAQFQGDALDLMQQGGQQLIEQMQQMMADQPGQGPGDPQQAQQRRGRDPLGRSVRNDGGWDTNGEFVPEESDLGRARGVLEELYRRSGQRSRPQLELDYYDRLLDRF